MLPPLRSAATNVNRVPAGMTGSNSLNDPLHSILIKLIPSKTHTILASTSTNIVSLFRLLQIFVRYHIVRMLKLWVAAGVV